MKNKDYYKTVEERADAFRKYLNEKNDDFTRSYIEGVLEWLEMEAEEKHPLPCPFCGSDVEPILRNGTEVGFAYLVSCKTCSYESRAHRNRDEAIAEHNRVVKKCIMKEKK